MKCVFYYDFPVGAMGIAEENGAVSRVFYDTRIITKSREAITTEINQACGGTPPNQACGGTPLNQARGGTPPNQACGGTPPYQARGGTPLCGYNVAETPVIKEAARQLKEYFGGTRTAFDLPLYLTGTDFQVSVWEALRALPAGGTCSYKELASSLGKPGASRAAGRACGSNRIMIIIPCHRVIGHSGSMTGYAGGLEIKKTLLDLERRYV